MTMYQPNIPTGTVPLNEDYLNLQNNFQQLDTTYGVDHVKYSVVDNNGFHKVIHMVHNSGNPAPTSGSGEIYTRKISDGFISDSSLFFQTATGINAQLTRNFHPLSDSTNGITFIPGGFILQWGRISATKADNSYTALSFTTSTQNKDFTNNCFCVFTQPFATSPPPSSGEQATVVIRRSSVSTTGFEWAYETNSAQYTGFYWIAIGN